MSYLAATMGEPGAASTAPALAETFLGGPDVRKATIDRFTAKFIVADSGCWEWTANRSADGYGTFWNGERTPPKDGKRGTTVSVLAHRWSYEHFIGPIPAGLNVLHHCDNPPCVNPAHLFAGTQAANVDDCVSKGRRNQTRYSKLSAEVHAEIRARYTGAYGQQTALAREYGVSQVTIGFIVGGRERQRCA